MSEAEVRAEGTAFGLSEQEVANVSVNELPTCKQVTAYPGNTKGLAFLEHLLSTGKAEAQRKPSSH